MSSATAAPSSAVARGCVVAAAAAASIRRTSSSSSSHGASRPMMMSSSSSSSSGSRLSGMRPMPTPTDGVPSLRRAATGTGGGGDVDEPTRGGGGGRFDGSGGTNVDLPAVTWTSPTWNWGSPRGDAHDCARVVRAHLNASTEARRQWLIALISSTPLLCAVPWEEAKLVMALTWQLSGHRGADACKNGGGSWLEILEKMRQGWYEGGMDGEDGGRVGGGDRLLAREMAQRIGPEGAAMVMDAKATAEQATNGDEEWVHDAVRRATCAAVLLENGFLEEGI